MIEKVSDEIQEFISVLFMHKKAYHFIQENRLWEGFWKYGWATRVGIFIAIVMSLQIFMVFFDWMDKLGGNETGLVESMGMLTIDIGNFFVGILKGSSAKYILLLFLEVIIFHFCIKSIGVLTDREYTPKFKDFVRAEIRMFKVVARSYFLELVIVMIITWLLSAVGLKWAALVIGFGVKCFYLGFAYMDNYLEQYDYNIKESVEISREHMGTAIGLGLVSYVLFFIPVVGLIAAPLLGAVTCTLFLYEKLPSDKPLKIDRA